MNQQSSKIDANKEAKSAVNEIIQSLDEYEKLVKMYRLQYSVSASSRSSAQNYE